MSKLIGLTLAFGLLVTGAACTQPAEEEFVVVDPNAISAASAPTGKY